MAIYRYDEEKIHTIEETSFATLGVRERGDIQRILRDQIEIIDDQLLVISEEYGRWTESRRRIDLLCIDKDANLVVVELKRTEDGGHMELQALRYSAMIANMTFQHATEAYEDYLQQRGIEKDARSDLLRFLEWDGSGDHDFGEEVRIVLVSAEFSKELTGAVLWLAEYGIDIRCVRMRPYRDGETILLDVQQVIPLPEAEDFQVKVREKKQTERVARQSSKDLTKFDVKIGGHARERQAKRHAIFLVVKALCDRGISPLEIANTIRKSDRRMYVIADGELSSEEMEDYIVAHAEGTRSQPGRWFTEDDELIYFEGRTYAFSKMWGKKTYELIQGLIQEFAPQDIIVEPATD